MAASPAIQISDVCFNYGERAALRDVSLEVKPGEIFALLGPNGGGKSTLFRLLATLIPLQQGNIEILSFSARTSADEIRRRVGIVFQSPSVDPKLRVWENIRHQGWLYGLSGRQLKLRGHEVLAQLGLVDRQRDSVETLSGGLRRRLELAKGMLHRPSLLLMDEPSTGLDPAARFDFWMCLRDLCAEHGVTVLLTTHLLEEAERADRVAILSAGEVVASGPPDELRQELGGETIVITAAENQAGSLAAQIQDRMRVSARVVEDQIHLAATSASEVVPKLLAEFGSAITELRLGKPTLEDVFIAKTGHRFWSGEGDEEQALEMAQRHGHGGSHD